MEKENKTKLLLKILIGVAWIDGTIQTEERKYLHDMATKQGLQEDAEIKSLLSEIKPVKPQECYQWLEEYFGAHPKSADSESLIENISALIYSDGNVDSQEAQLLNRLFEPSTSDSSHSPFDKVIKTIQKLYRQAINQQA